MPVSRFLSPELVMQSGKGKLGLKCTSLLEDRCVQLVGDARLALRGVRGLKSTRLASRA